MNFKGLSNINTRRKELLAIKKRLYYHVDILARKIGPRNELHYSALNKASQYIAEQMSLSSDNFVQQQYYHEKKLFSNLIAESIGERKPQEIFVIGAHYDSIADSPGADDNATGIACLLELVRLLRDYPNQRTLRFVAFTLEEPPFFATDKMGSDVYARSCHEKNENIVGMIALEMLGFFSERKGTQKHPVTGSIGTYPDKGNFIALVANDLSRQLVLTFVEHLKQTGLIMIETIVPTSYFQGIDLSDHASFWKYKYPALMVTDTAFYRNPNYHEISDKIDTINFKYFTRLVFSMAYAIQKLDQEDSF